MGHGPFGAPTRPAIPMDPFVVTQASTLLEAGAFDDGVATGTWSTWTAEGAIHRIVEFRQGQATFTVGPPAPEGDGCDPVLSHVLLVAANNDPRRCQAWTDVAAPTLWDVRWTVGPMGLESLAVEAPPWVDHCLDRELRLIRFPPSSKTCQVSFPHTSR